MQPALGLKPLTREAEVGVRAGGGEHATEGEIGDAPNLGAGRIRGEDRAADMVGSDADDRVDPKGSRYSDTIAEETILGFFGFGAC